MAKTPVMAAASGALATRIKHGVNGLLFNPGDLKTMTQHIRYVIDNPEALETLRGRIPEVMTIERYYRDIEGIIRMKIVIDIESLRHTRRDFPNIHINSYAD